MFLSLELLEQCLTQGDTLCAACLVLTHMNSLQVPYGKECVLTYVHLCGCRGPYVHVNVMVTERTFFRTH